MNEDQLYIPSTEVDVNLNSPHNNGTSGGFDFDKYGPYVDAIKNLLVPSLEKSIYEGLEVFVYGQKDSLSSQFPGFGKCLKVATTFGGPLSEICGNTNPEDVGIIQGIIKPALRYLIKDGLINCFINAVVLNNRLNKICRDLDIIKFGRNISPYISTLNYVNESDHCSGYTDVSKSLSHRSVGSITISSHVQSDAESSSSVNELLENHDDVKKYRQNHSDILVDSCSSIYIISKAQDNTEPHNAKEGVSLSKKKIITGSSSKYGDAKLEKPNTEFDWKDKNLTVVISKSNNCSEVNKSSLPCNCENLLRKIIKTDLSSSDSHLVEQLEKLEIAMQNTCFSLNDILGQMDKKNVNKCRLFCKIREKYIDFKLKMKNHDGSMTNLFIDRIKITKNDSQGFEKPSTSLEVDKSERDDAESSSRFNFTFNEISDGNIDGVTQRVIRNSNLDKDSGKDKLLTPSKIHEDIFSLTKNKDSFVIKEKKNSKECNSENSCDCSTSTESSKIITKGPANICPIISCNVDYDYDEKDKIGNKNKTQSDENVKNFFSIRFKDDVEYYENNNSVSTQAVNNNKTIKETDSMISNVDYDIFEKSQVFEILKTIFEENESQICSCNAEDVKKEKFIAETSIEHALDRDKLRDDSSSSNHIVSLVSSGISLASKITRVIPVENIEAEVNNKYENNFDHFCDLDETELNKRTSTPERKKEIENLLNREYYEMQEFDKNKIRSYSSRSLSEILAEGKKNSLSDSPKDKFDHYNEYFEVMKEIDDNKRNSTSQKVKEVGNLSKKNSQARDNNKNDIKSYSGSNRSEIITKNRQKLSSTPQRDKYDSYNEHFHVIDEIEEKNHNLSPESNEEEENLSEKNIELQNGDENEMKLGCNEKMSESIKKHLSTSEKTDHNCEYFYLLDEIEENNRTSTPERKREIESLLKKEDLSLQDVNKDKSKSYFSKNITEGLLEVRKKRSSISQEERTRETDDFVASRLNENCRNSFVISKKLSNPSRKVSHVYKIPRSISQKEVNHKNTSFYPNNISLNDLTSICQCSSDSDTSQDANFKIPPLKDQSFKNKKKEKKSNNLPRRHFNIRALISAVCRGLRNIFSRATLRKLKHLLKKRIFKLTKKREKTTNTSGVCVPKSCSNRVQNYNSIDSKKSKINNNITDEYPDRLSNNLKRENINLSSHQQSKGSYSKYRPGVISKDKQRSEYTCCRDQNNLREDWVNPRIVNLHQSINVSLSSNDCDAAKKRLYHRKYMRRRPSEYSILNDKKFRRSSLSSKESQPCCYYKNLAAKHLAEYLNFRLRHQEMSDTDEVHCKECLESTDSELKSMLTEYLKSSRSEKKRSVQKKHEEGCFND